MKEKILIAEDEKRLCKVYDLYFKGEGYDVVFAHDGNSAEKLIDNGKFDIIILDVMMPGKDGWSLLRKIKSKSDTPVIMTTSRGEEEDRIFGFELGADDYMVKPISMRELMLRISLRIKKSEKADTSSDIIEAGNLTISEDRREVIEGGQVAVLTPKEFELLVYLIKNPNVVMKRGTLLDYVWGYTYSGDTRTVDTHIKNLREKVGFCNENLKTVWGVGYKLELQEGAKLGHAENE
ncbi:MAG: response regulator transcription factor [Clostridium sp.]|uniref:response regulator transcription factor n=1 Tax=Clostridium sp. TaxID=1506 RepID=UPI002FC7F142